MWLSFKFRSHSAAGNTYDIVVVSKTDDHPAAVDMMYRIMLNFPKPEAVIAVSKSAGFESEKK